MREFRLPDEYGDTGFFGGVTVLDNGNWLISWYNWANVSVPIEETIAISEVDSNGDAVFHLNMHKGDRVATSYRVYRYPAPSVSIPLNPP